MSRILSLEPTEQSPLRHRNKEVSKIIIKKKQVVPFEPPVKECQFNPHNPFLEFYVTKFSHMFYVAKILLDLVLDQNPP